MQQVADEHRHVTAGLERHDAVPWGVAWAVGGQCPVPAMTLKQRGWLVVTGACRPGCRG